MAWWIPLAMAAGGYVIDKQMGGNGMKGALLGAAGGAMLPAGAGLASGTAATTAGNVAAGGISGGVATGTALGSGGYAATSNAYLGAGGSGLLGGAATSSYPELLLGNTAGNANAYAIPETLGNSVTGVTSDLASQSMMANPNLSGIAGAQQGTGGYTGNGLTNLFTQGKDYISEGISDMTFSDQLGVGLQAQGLLNRPTRRIQVDRPGISQNKNIGYAKKYETVVEGIPVPPEEEITEEEYYSLLRNK
jgi:hypothetical protein